MKAENFIELIEQNRFDKISKDGMTLIAKRFRELEKQALILNSSSLPLKEKVAMSFDEYKNSYYIKQGFNTYVGKYTKGYYSGTDLIKNYERLISDL